MINTDNSHHRDVPCSIWKKMIKAMFLASFWKTFNNQHLYEDAQRTIDRTLYCKEAALPLVLLNNKTWLYFTRIQNAILRNSFLFKQWLIQTCLPWVPSFESLKSCLRLFSKELKMISSVKLQATPKPGVVFRSIQKCLRT